MKKIFLLGFLLLTVPLFASRQVSDRVIFNDRQYNTLSFPLEIYFETYPERRPEITHWISALTRGYIATFEVINNELILIDIDENFLNDYLWLGMKMAFFTGKINLINGEATGVNSGFMPIYQNYLVLEVREGVVIASYNLTAYEYLQSLIQAFPEGSSAQNHFIRLLEELNRRQ
ncbi:MAG: hypothetical protein FWE37_06300 [Spirochaetaceae bacterium]|nr:hypothetical protein [Spirochaetaceae bacterium]